jgi:hypothetical protein
LKFSQDNKLIIWVEYQIYEKSIMKNLKSIASQIK